MARLRAVVVSHARSRPGQITSRCRQARSMASCARSSARCLSPPVRCTASRISGPRWRAYSSAVNTPPSGMAVVLLVLLAGRGGQVAPGAAPAGIGGRVAGSPDRAPGGREGSPLGADRDHDPQPPPALGQLVPVSAGRAGPGHLPAPGALVVHMDGEAVPAAGEGHDDRAARPPRPGVPQRVGDQLGDHQPRLGTGHPPGGGYRLRPAAHPGHLPGTAREHPRRHTQLTIRAGPAAGNPAVDRPAHRTPPPSRARSAAYAAASTSCRPGSAHSPSPTQTAQSPYTTSHAPASASACPTVSVSAADSTTAPGSATRPPPP